TQLATLTEQLESLKLEMMKQQPTAPDGPYEVFDFKSSTSSYRYQGQRLEQLAEHLIQEEISNIVPLEHQSDWDWNSPSDAPSQDDSDMTDLLKIVDQVCQPEIMDAEGDDDLAACLQIIEQAITPISGPVLSPDTFPRSLKPAGTGRTRPRIRIEYSPEYEEETIMEVGARP
ncbi:hypothetical protein HDU91_003839, partial [Kappamyces sp. JEL0680]